MEAWGTIVERIYNTLQQNGYNHLANEMTDEYSVGGTSGEMFSIVCVWLAKLRNSDHTAYSVVKSDADSLLDYAVEIRYFTKSELGKK